MKMNDIQPGNRFVDQLNFYQSANSDNESVKRNFVIRREEFELVIADLANKKKTDPLQHELFLGRRGSGKSTLLKRIEIEIGESPALAKKYVAVNLAEEQAGIYRLHDLWLEILKEVGIKLKNPVAPRDYTSFTDEQVYTRYLYTEIQQLLERKQKKAVILLDNLDRIVENFSDDGNLLRETLLNHNDMQIIGGSTRMDEHFWRYDKPFYEFFRRHRLGALSSAEIHSLLTHWGKIMELPELSNFAKRNPGKIEAIRILTDGLPRTLQFFIQVLLQDSTLYGFDYIRKVMDNITPLYQERLNSLPPPQRKIVQEMSFLWEACTARQLADKCRMESKLVSAQLKQLTISGIVETISTDKKNHLYRLSERFFNMWLIVTQGNPEQKRKAKWLTIFLETWYDAAELKNMVVRHIQNLLANKIPFDKAIILTKALSQSRHTSTQQRDQMLDFTMKLNVAKNKDHLLELPQKYAETTQQISHLVSQKKYQQAHSIIDDFENEEDGVKFFIKAYIYQAEEILMEAKKYYLLAIEKGDTNSSNNLAIIYENERNRKEAEKQYLIAIEKGHSLAHFNLANLYKNEGNRKEAEKYYLHAIDKGDTNSLVNLGNLYYDEGNLKEAEKYYLHAIDKGNKIALFNLGRLYNNEGKLQEAEKYYLRATEKGDTEALFRLALLYYSEGELNKAEKYYLRAIEKGNKVSLLGLALLYYSSNRNKKISLLLAEEYNQTENETNSIWIEIIIKIWNGLFENIEENTIKLVSNSSNEGLDFFITHLLVQQQEQLVLKLFHHQEHGKPLRERYALLYYAALLLTGSNEIDNLPLRIPPEVMPTVTAIIKNIKEGQAFYATPQD